MPTPDLIPVPEQDTIDLAKDASPEDVRDALSSLSTKYESLKNILAQNINRLSLSSGAKGRKSTLLVQPKTRREDYALKAGLEVGLRTTTAVGAKFCRLAVGPHIIEKPWGATEAGMVTENARGLRRSLPGTITVSATTVTGVGTQFTRDFFIGDVISVYNAEYPASTNAIVTVITNDTTMTIAATMTVPTASAYKRNGHDTTPPFSLEATYTDGTTVGLNKLDQPFVNLTGTVFSIGAASTSIYGVDTNLMLQSADFTAATAAWTLTSVTVTGNAVQDPLGGTGTTADQMFEVAATSVHQVSQTVATRRASSTVVASAYFKKSATSRDHVYLQVDDGVPTNYFRQWFNLATGNIGAAESSGWSLVAGTAVMTNTGLGAGWYRCSMVITTTTGTSIQMRLGMTAADAVESYAGDITYSTYIWGAQCQQGGTGLTLSAYVPTTTAALTSTQFTREYRVGDNIMVASATTQMRRITAIVSDRNMTVHANTSAAILNRTHQKRSWLAVHVCTNETGNKIGMVLSKYSHNPKLPPGFSFSRRVGWVRFLDTTGNTEVFARFLYDGEEDIWWWNEELNAQSQFSVIYNTGFTANTYTNVSASAAMPPTARHSKSSCYIDCQAGAVARVGFKNAQQFAIANAVLTTTAIWGEVSGSNDIALTEDIPVCTCQQFAINTNNANHVFYLTVWGYQDII